MNAVILNLPGCNVCKRGVTEERCEVYADMNGLRFHISGISLTLGDNLKFIDKSFDHICEVGIGWLSPLTAINGRNGLCD